MADFRFRELERFIKDREGDLLKLAVPLPVSAAGMTTLFCPNGDCAPRAFQLGELSGASTAPERQRRPREQSATTCPYCGVDGEQETFFHPDDLEAAKKQIEWAFMRDVSTHFHGLARDFNRRSSKGLFSISMDVKPDRTPAPFFHRQDLLRQLTCDACGRGYGVYAVGLFCPDCAAANVHVHFERECMLVEQQIALAQELEAERGMELSYRVLGNAHEDVVTALETYLKTVYRFLVRRRRTIEEAASLCSKKAIGNAFQNIARGQALFAQLGIDPYRSLSAEELDTLRINLEKRHVLGHNLGLIDEAYAGVIGSERVGESVPLVAEEVRAFAALTRRVVETLESEPEFSQPVSVASGDA